jgi:hypothetical protein
MEELEKLLKSVEKIKDEKSADETFKKIACELMSNYEIRKGEETYDFIEIEFYYHSEKHPDTSVYARNTEIGQWFTHLSGVDIAFESTEEEISARKFVNVHGGGILIRSIRNRKTKEFICGPLNTMIFLFNYIHFCLNNNNDIPVIEKRKIKDSNSIKILRTGRFNIKSPEKYRY